MNNKVKIFLGALLIAGIATPAFAGPRHKKHHNEGVHLAAEIIGLVGHALNIVNPQPKTVVVANPAPAQTVIVNQPAPVQTVIVDRPVRRPVIVTPPRRPVVIRRSSPPPRRPVHARPQHRGGQHEKRPGGHRR